MRERLGDLVIPVPLPRRLLGGTRLRARGSPLRGADPRAPRRPGLGERRRERAPPAIRGHRRARRRALPGLLPGRRRRRASPGPGPWERRGVVEEVTASGLRGRGGSWRPVGERWQALRERGGARYLVADLLEPEPGRFSATASWRSATPTGCWRACAIAALATGASAAFLCIPRRRGAGAEGPGRGPCGTGRGGRDRRPRTGHPPAPGARTAADRRGRQPAPQT